MKKNIFLYALVLIIAILIRFIYLGLVPPLGIININLRIYTVITSILSILLLMLLVKKYSQDSQLAYLSGLILSFMPWHIEQSRVYSQVMLALAWLLLGIYLFQYFKNKLIKITASIFYITLIYFIYPSFWIFSGKWPILDRIIPNLFKLISGEFIFFKNDTFWWGGLRNFGILLPSTIVIFLIGLFRTIKTLNKKYIWPMIFLFLIWIFSALSPFFPESREFFFITPILAIISAIGFKYIFHYYKKGNKLIKILLITYAFIVIYDYINFFHFYFKHYPKRIHNELKYEQINF